MPVGTPMDGTLCYGLPPLTQRERYYEAHDLITRAWTAEEPFPWNGKYFQLPCVNTWPRPVQEPHPPIWVPGTVSPGTWDFVAAHDHAYMVLTAFSGQLGISDSIRLVKGFWDRADAHGRDRNPFRAGIALMPIIGDSMAQIERDYFQHIRYTFAGTTHIAPEHLNPPGYQDYKGLLNILQRAGAATDQTGGALGSGRFDDWTFKDYVDNEIVVAGTAAEVAEQIESYVREMNAGHLMVMLQLGSMPKELTFQSIDAFAEGVLPRLRPLFEDEWENRWWPERLRAPRSETEAIGARGR
jgi:alkanesulfonate monooxygenase SsuD/methylene tetrahydromethanopterin reductase-like flavin-dependent oxidoreductase (luciferase family)